jgi:hypothetical protein
MECCVAEGWWAWCQASPEKDAAFMDLDLLINSATAAKVSRDAMMHNSPEDGMSQNPFPFESIDLKKLNY